MSETFWYSDPSVLFNKDTWYKFVPTARMSVPEALNSVVRFSIYMTILLVLTSHKPLYVLFVPTVMFISIVLNGYFPRTKKIVESFRSGTAISGYTGTEVTRPTLDNPFMNPTLVDIKENPNRPPAADPTDIKIRDDINAAFAQTSNIYMDTSDIFSLVQAQRNFYTVPEDDHEGLLKFLGKNAQTDKLLNEGYVAAKGTVAELPSPAISKPSGSAPSSSLTG
jgi:hypothetical protein